MTPSNHITLSTTSQIPSNQSQWPNKQRNLLCLPMDIPPHPGLSQLTLESFLATSKSLTTSFESAISRQHLKRRNSLAFTLISTPPICGAHSQNTRTRFRSKLSSKRSLPYILVPKTSENGLLQTWTNSLANVFELGS